MKTVQLKLFDTLVVLDT